MNRILVICGDQYHPADVVMSGLRAAGGPEFVFEQAATGPILSLERELSAIVLAKINVSSPTDQTAWANEDSDHLLRKFVEEGKGMLVIHAGTVGYGGTEAIRRMTGGAFLRHPEPCQISIEPVTPSESLRPFVVHDEHYFVELDPGNEIFLNSASCHGKQPAGWRLNVGKGRVSVVTPGHFRDVWSHQQFMHLLRFELEWVVNA